MKSRRKPQGEKRFSPEQMMLNVASLLARDFQNNFNDPALFRDFRTALRSNSLSEIRGVNWNMEEDCEPALYKAKYQLQSVLKRYRFTNDLYSDAELTTKSIETFMDTQSRLRGVRLDALPEQEQRVLYLARSYITKVLGEYSDEEHRSLCRFGRKASVGIPARLACEAARWELPLTGSLNQILWFDSEMSQYECVQNYWNAQLEKNPKGSIYREVDCLALTLVPKTFKSLRSIMPNTTIGSYMSYGLGIMMRNRLKKEGYDISSLQMKHRYLAQEGSKHGLYATADLSSASDSISDELVRFLFPADWYNILNQSRIDKVKLPDGTVVQSLTHCTMGVGYTFPLQTLVFLSLLKAIEATMYDRLDRRLISVYGDDMVYNPRIHHKVLEVFPQLGFVLNVDKTFATGPFRESCGGDYYHGVDVRPFQPRNGSDSIGDKAYESVLYKTINGLLARWSEYEISGTLEYLCGEINECCGTLKLVPLDFPDDSGIKCSTLKGPNFVLPFLCNRPKHIGHGVFRFSYLRLKSDVRKEVRHDPYLWVRLRDGIFAVLDYSSTADARQLSRTPLQELIELRCNVVADESPLMTIRDLPRWEDRLLCGPPEFRSSTYVTVSHTGRYKRQSGTSCFECRR